jgi:uncharacterized NAD(P)/FAD-binding protein YdhS
MNQAGERSIVIVGGGASGVLLAAHLLRGSAAGVRVTLIEKRAQLGRGVAYSARQLDHVLNVPAPNMSAFADDPEHFWRWLTARGLVAADERQAFVARRHYGAYLAEVIEAAGKTGRLTVVADVAVEVREAEAGVTIVLGSGARIDADVAVLAVGHEEHPARGKGIAVRAGSDDDTPLDADAKVLILGSGLSMVDAWLTLAQARHRGPIIVVSRHGLLPQAHRATEKLVLEADAVPVGADLPRFTRWFRGTVRAAVASGTDWRGVVDGLRPFNQRIWQGWSRRSRKQFLQHVRPFWNIHRHRLPPELHQRLTDAIASGQVQLRAGHLVDLARDGEGVVASVQPKGKGAPEALVVARVYDCGGVTADVEQSSNRVVRQLLAEGRGRADGLHIGLDVTPDCAVIGRDGTASARLFAIGPLTRGTFFEIEAIPDIRVQAAELAERLGATR